MKIKDINKENRPRERMILNGPQHLSDEELLAIIIKCGNKEKSAIDLSREIINSAGNIQKLFNLSYEDLLKINGIKEAKASTIIASFELSKRAMSYITTNMELSSSKKIFKYLNPLMSLEEREVLYVIFLNSKCKLIRSIKYPNGSVKEINVPKQKILADAIKYGARFIVISHNHPSGDKFPSKADIDFTLDFKDCLSMLDILLVDHIIISNNDYYSFSDEKII